VATLPGGKRLVVFLEAKAGTYRDSAADFTAGRGKGFNSTINGQLTLRFRLAKALAAYEGTADRLVETPAWARAYGEETIPRFLCKEDNLKQIVQRYIIGGAEYYFVSLTNDHENVWRGPAQRIRASALRPETAGWGRTRSAGDVCGGTMDHNSQCVDPTSVALWVDKLQSCC
jgi:hypothetical protein